MPAPRSPDGTLAVASRYLLFTLLPLPVVALLLHLIGHSWSAYDIGINAAANSLALVFCVAPVALVLFYGATLVIMARAIRRGHGPWELTARYLATVVGVFVVLFGLAIAAVADYPSPDTESLAQFLLHYPRTWPR